MKLLIFACLLAVSLAAPVAKPDDDDDNVAVAYTQEEVTAVASGVPTIISNQIVSGTPVFHHNAVSYRGPTSFKAGAQIIGGAMPYRATVPVIHTVEKIDDDDVKFIEQRYGTFTHAPAGVIVAVSPAVVAYGAEHALASPVLASQYQAQGVEFPAVATYAAGHAVASPVVATHAVAAPVQYHAAVAPAVAIQQEAIVQEVKPVSVAVPTAITYEAAHTVQLQPKEISVPVHHQTVHVPVEQRVHYGTENYVAGSTVTVHKPQISAPAISVPNVFVAKTRHAAPEVTVHHSEVTVEQKSPNYVAAAYDAGVVLEKVAPQVNQIDVPTPVEVPHPVNVPTPYAVPVAHPVKVKSSVNPVVNVDVHTVQTENLVTPIEYAAHHHVATAPVVSAPAVAVQAAPAVGFAASAAPTAVAYGASVSPAAVAVQGIAAHGVGVASHGVVSQGAVSGSPSIGYASVPIGQNYIIGSSAPEFVGGSFTGVPAASFAGHGIKQTEANIIQLGAQTGTASHVTTYSGGQPGTGQQVVVGNPNFVAAPVAQVSFRHLDNNK